jgi:hypothetical protein
MKLASNSLGLDFNATAKLLSSKPTMETPFQVFRSIQSSQLLLIEESEHPPLYALNHQIPGLLRGIQTWLLIGIPLAAAIAAIYLRVVDKKTFYFLIPLSGNKPNIFGITSQVQI